MVYKINEDREKKKMEKDIKILIILYITVLIVAIGSFIYISRSINSRLEAFEATQWELLHNECVCDVKVNDINQGVLNGSLTYGIAVNGVRQSNEYGLGGKDVKAPGYTFVLPVTNNSTRQDTFNPQQAGMNQ
jgi:hypothetical protein